MPGIKSELWQLKTHPLLMQGASMQLTLRGVALYQDQTADKRLFIQVLHHQAVPDCVFLLSFIHSFSHNVLPPTLANWFILCVCLRLFCADEQSRLEKIVCVNVCQTIVDEVLQGIHTPERPSSPAEIYVTEEQEFLKKNPKVRGKRRRVALCVVCQPSAAGSVWDYWLFNLTKKKKEVCIVFFSFVLST